MGSWRNDANRCRSNCTHSHLIYHRCRVMSALLFCADFARTDPVSAYSARLVACEIGTNRTNRAGLTMSVLRGRPEVPAHGQGDAIEPVHQQCQQCALRVDFAEAGVQVALTLFPEMRSPTTPGLRVVGLFRSLTARLSATEPHHPKHYLGDVGRMVVHRLTRPPGQPSSRLVAARFVAASPRKPAIARNFRTQPAAPAFENYQHATNSAPREHKTFDALNFLCV